MANVLPKSEPAAPDLEKARTLPSIISSTSPASPIPPRCQVFKVQGRKSIADLESRLGADLFAAVLRINRLDRKHLRTGEVLVIPEADVSPFPLKLDAAGAIAKLVLVSRRAQAFGAYESGKLVRWGPTSTGKKSTPTPAGLFHTNWKARSTRSSVNASWILPWCFNIDNHAGVSFHQFDLPGYPASHGCIRLLEEDAKWIYNWADAWMLSQPSQSLRAYGTPVVVFGDCSYREKPPWKRLVDDPTAAEISPAEIERALNEYLRTIASRARTRESLIAQLAPPTE